MSEHVRTVNGFRRFLLVLSGLVFAGTVPELIFTEHTETAMQWVPFGLCGLGVVSVLLVWLQSSPGLLKTHRVLMLLIALGGLFGVYEHLSHNYLFEAEIRPNATALESLGRAFFGSSPLMAPGILTLGAILSLAFTWRHPLLTEEGQNENEHH